MDPTGFDAGDMNLFRYCDDDPVDRSDPTGLVDRDVNASIWNRLRIFDTSSSSQESLSDLNEALNRSSTGSDFTMAGQYRNDGNATGAMKYVPKNGETEDFRYHKYYHLQLSTSDGKPVPGYNYFTQERTTVKVNDFSANGKKFKADVKRTDNEPLAELPRSGVFRDRVGLGSYPSSRVSGTLILDQRFVLTFEGQGIGVSTILRHITVVNEGQVTNGVSVINP